MKEIEEGKCCVTVYPNEQWGIFHGHQCTRKATVERDGKHYCTIHDPVRIQEKREARHKKWDEESKANGEKWHREDTIREACKDVSTITLEKIKVKTLLARIDELERAIMEIKSVMDDPKKREEYVLFGPRFIAPYLQKLYSHIE